MNVNLAGHSTYNWTAVRPTAAAEVCGSDFFHSCSAPVFQNLTAAHGMTTDYKKIIDSCSYFTPVTGCK